MDLPAVVCACAGNAAAQAVTAMPVTHGQSVRLPAMPGTAADSALISAQQFKYDPGEIPE